MAKKKSKKKPVKKVVKKVAKAAKKVKPSKGKVVSKIKNSMVTVYLSLGSNVGDREEYIEQVFFLLEKNPHIKVAKHSNNYETEAEGGTGVQPKYLNAVVEIKTKLSAHALLEICQEIEAALGRERELEWGPRTMDIDILLYGDQVLSDDKLQIPHPLMHERLFVLKPMNEIAPTMIHPVLEKTMANLYEERKAEAGDTYDDELPGFKDIKSAGTDDFERW